MSDNNNLLGEALEKGMSAVKATGKGVAKATSDVTKGAISQATGIPIPSSDNLPDSVPSQDSLPKGPTTEDVVESLYKSPPQASGNEVPPGSPAQAQGEAEREAETERNLADVRKRLHDAYYQTLIHPQKEEEERPAEKVEREEKQEMADLQKEEMGKPPPLPIQRQTQRVEKFPGASG